MNNDWIIDQIDAQILKLQQAKSIDDPGVGSMNCLKIGIGMILSVARAIINYYVYCMCKRKAEMS